MIDPKKIIKIFNKKKINFFAGVPDSTLKSFISELNTNKKIKHVVSVNEGSSVASAMGYYLSTKKTALVYMQNSGIGHALNPILSLCNYKMYSLPLILLIGLRGEKGYGKEGIKKDEPQHELVGPTTISILKAAKIKTTVLNKKKYFFQINKVCNEVKKNSSIQAIIVKRGLIQSYKTKKNDRGPKRFDYLSYLLAHRKKNDIYVCSTGFSAREVYYLNEYYKYGHSKTFYCVGAMGHGSTIAKEIAQIKKTKRVVMVDGDGAALMHLGSMTSTLNRSLKNFIHIIFNNNEHESTGNHPISTEKFNFSKMFNLCGYKKTYELKNLNEFKKCLIKLNNQNLQGPIGIVIKTKSGTIKNLPRQKAPKKLKQIIKF